MTTAMPSRQSRTKVGELEKRREAMAIFAQASSRELSEGLRAVSPPAHHQLRPVETGLIMVRGRIGGDGAPFNLGEATVTRAAIQLPNGKTGFSYVLGRDREKARLAALADALWQTSEYRVEVERQVIEPVRTRLQIESKRVREETAATRVNFFTLVRGED